MISDSKSYKMSMSNQYLLSIDNGGTNTKAVIFNLHGVEIAESSFPTPRREPQPGF